MRIAGFVVVGLTLVVGLAMFSLVDDYVPGAGLGFNLSNAKVGITQQGYTVRDCPHPSLSGHRVVPEGCPTSPPVYDRASDTPVYRAATEVEVFAVPLGVAAALVVGVAFTGLGLMVFGRGRARIDRQGSNG